MRAHAAMKASGLTFKRLGDVADRIFMPPRSRRVYVPEEYGIPFLQGSHLPHFRPAGLKYVSKYAHANIDEWRIKSGWVLVTRSGTIGRVAVALDQWDDWAASEHIIRIVPETDGQCSPWYIAAWLSSPLGQAQFNAIYGAVVDELTPEHVADILIPVPETERQREIVDAISTLARDAVATKELALLQDATAIEEIGALFPDDYLDEIMLEPASPTGPDIKAPVARVSSELLYQAERRLDAGFYNATTMKAHAVMESSGLHMARLGDVTDEVFIPPCSDACMSSQSMELRSFKAAISSISGPPG